MEMKAITSSAVERIVLLLCILCFVTEVMLLLQLRRQRRRREADVLIKNELAEELKTLGRQKDDLLAGLDSIGTEMQYRLYAGFSECAGRLESVPNQMPETVTCEYTADQEAGLLELRLSGAASAVEDAARRLWTAPYRPAAAEFGYALEPDNRSSLVLVFSVMPIRGALPKRLQQDIFSLPEIGRSEYRGGGEEEKAAAWARLSEIMWSLMKITEDSKHDSRVLTDIAERNPYDAVPATEPPAAVQLHSRLVGSIMDQNGLLLIHKDTKSGELYYERQQKDSNRKK
jgi:hypothetical protein